MHERVRRRGIDHRTGADLRSNPLHKSCQKFIRQQQNISLTGSERWERDGEYVQAIIEVFAECASSAQSFEILIGRRDYPDIYIHKSSSTHTPHLSLL